MGGYKVRRFSLDPHFTASRALRAPSSSPGGEMRSKYGSGVVWLSQIRAERGDMTRLMRRHLSKTGWSSLLKRWIARENKSAHL